MSISFCDSNKLFLCPECGIGGDVILLVSKLEKLDSLLAVHFLIDNYCTLETVIQLCEARKNKNPLERFKLHSDYILDNITISRIFKSYKIEEGNCPFCKRIESSRGKK